MTYRSLSWSGSRASTFCSRAVSRASTFCPRASTGISLGLLLLACDGEKAADVAPAPSAEVAPKVEPAAQAAAAPAPVAATAKIEENTYRLAFEGAGPFVADQQGKVKVVLTALGGYHVNPDYPIRVDLTGPAGLKLDKTSLTRPDAAAFGEESASFEVAFTGQKGEHELRATVDFAVCTKETCVPDQRTIALKLPVM